MFVDFLDELGSGIAPISATEIRDELSLSHGGLALMMLTAPFVVALVVESPLLLRSDRWQRERAAAVCMAIMGLAMFAAALATAPWMFALALGVWGSAGGVGCGVSQGALMDAHPEARERWMTRWTLMGSLGDLATPLLILAVAALGYGWRAALAGTGVAFAIHALVLSRVRVGRGADEDDGGEGGDEGGGDEPASMVALLREGVADSELMAWLAGSALCCLLDEILVAFGVLYLRDEFGASQTLQGLAFMVCSLGGVVGLGLSERLLGRRVDPLRLLAGSALACALIYAGWLAAPTPAISVLALGLLGVSVAPLYPICAARAYATRPERPGLVAAIDQVFTPFALLAPLLIGLLADELGLLVALAVLVLQPVGILFIVAGQRRRRGEVEDGLARRR